MATGGYLDMSFQSLFANVSPMVSGMLHSATGDVALMFEDEIDDGREEGGGLEEEEAKGGGEDGRGEGARQPLREMDLCVTPRTDNRVGLVRWVKYQRRYVWVCDGATLNDE